MKKLISAVLAFIVLFVYFSPVISAATASSSQHTTQTELDLTSFSKTAGFDFNFQPATNLWKNIVGSEQPVQLPATYTLKSNVKIVGDTFDANIKSAGQILVGSAVDNQPAMETVADGAYINKEILQAVVGKQEVIQPGTVFLNEETGTAFKVVVPMDAGEVTAPFKDNYAVTQPQINEVVSDFQIPPCQVTLNKANINSFVKLANSASSIETFIVQPGQTQVMSTGDQYASFKYLKNALIQFKFPEGTELKGSIGNGQEVTVKIKGGLALGDLGLVAEYSGFDGYEFALLAAEESYLSVDVGININQEIYIPILGIDVPFGVGRVGGGLYLVVGMNGKVTIQIRAREYMSCKMGLRGNTFCYIPTSCRPIMNLSQPKLDGDVDVDGQINGYIKAGAMVTLEIFGWDLVGAGVFIGAGVNISSSNSLLDIELYGLIQIYVTFAGDTYNLVYAKPTIMRKTQKDMGGYRATIEEACAYQDLVVGFLQTSQNEGADIKLTPAALTDFQIVVTSFSGGAVTTYPAADAYYQSDSFGRFLVQGFADLRVGDDVAIQVIAAGKTYGPCLPVKATYPFKTIEVTAADPFNDWIQGQVDPARVRNWNKQPGEDDYKILLFQGDVGIQIQKMKNMHRETVYTVHVKTDVNGQFRAENGNLKDGDPVLDVQSWNLFTANIDSDNALASTESYIAPKTIFTTRTVLETVPGSAKRYIENGRTIDQVTVNERVFIINMGGSKQLTDVTDSVICDIYGFSSQDIVNKWKGVDLGAKNRTIQLMSDPPVNTTSGETYGTSYFDLTFVKEWVWQNHKNPTIITSANHYECTTDGGAFPVTAIGVPPFIFGIKNAPVGVSIKSDSGVMSIANTAAPGIYPFTVMVSCDIKAHMPSDPPEYTEDLYPPVEQAFTLTVTQLEQIPTPTPSPSPTPTLSPTPSPTTKPSPSASPTPTLIPTPMPAAPVITSLDKGYLTPEGGTWQVTATGAAPITFSLPEDSPDYPLPERITIDPQTGVMTVGSDRPLGEYDFYINAHNSVGDASQLFHLLIVRTLPSATNNVIIGGSSPYLRSQNPYQLLGTSAPSDADIRFLSVSKSKATNTATNPPSNLVVQNIPISLPSRFLLRNDDPEDLYDSDMFIINGADYVKWDISFSLSTGEGTASFIIRDKTPMNDHHLKYVEPNIEQEINDMRQKQLDDFKNGHFGPDFETGLDDFLGDIFKSTVIDYGSIIDMIHGQNGGILGVNLTESSGALLPGKVFNALKEKVGAGVGLALNQNGAKITFMSHAIINVSGDQLFDFSYFAQAGNDAVMKQAAGSKASSFTYAFAHNGSLPGYAQFAISTNLAAGTKVNVYKYDADGKQFSLIAGGIQVDKNGIVTYMNDTTSEYLITTALLNGAILTDAYTQYNNNSEKSNKQLIFIFVGIIMLVITGVITTILIRRKAAKNK